MNGKEKMTEIMVSDLRFYSAEVFFFVSVRAGVKVYAHRVSWHRWGAA